MDGSRPDWNGDGLDGFCATDQYNYGSGHGVPCERGAGFRDGAIDLARIHDVEQPAVLAGRTMVTVGADGFLSVNLAPNMGSSPAGLYYTATYHMSDGTTNTEYRWCYSAELLGVFCRLVF